jgi:hypothetical protein
LFLPFVLNLTVKLSEPEDALFSQQRNTHFRYGCNKFLQIQGKKAGHQFMEQSPSRENSLSADQ